MEKNVPRHSGLIRIIVCAAGIRPALVPSDKSLDYCAMFSISQFDNDGFHLTLVAIRTYSM